MLIHIKSHSISKFEIPGSRAPFSLRFISDHWEVAEEMGEAKDPGKGARLAYELISCGN